MKNLNVVIIHNIISPHTISLFRELAKKVDLTVFYCAEKEKNRRWKETPTGFNYKVLPNFSVKLQGKDLFTYFINPTVFKELSSLKPDVVMLAGWDLFAYQVAFIYCKLKKIKIILWSGSTKYEPSWRRTLASSLVRLIISASDAFVVYGQRAKEYLVELGANKNKIFVSYNTTDIDKYEELCRKYLTNKLMLKKSLELTGKRIILYYGQLIERKGADVLIKAFARVKDKIADLALLIIGSGVYKDELVDLSTNLNSSDVKFIDDPGDEQISRYYSVADIFVLPSREEVWGLVVNQAMVCGLPVIVSNVAGCSADLVKEGENGYVFRSGSVNDLTKKIFLILGNENKSREMGKVSHRIMDNFTPQKTVGGVLAAIKEVTK